MPGSNRRPPRCKRGALPAELTPHAGVQCRGSSGVWPPRRPRSWRARRPALKVCGSASRFRPPCSRRRIRASSASRFRPSAATPSRRGRARGRRAPPRARRARRCARRAPRACARTPARRRAARRASPRSLELVRRLGRLGLPARLGLVGALPRALPRARRARSPASVSVCSSSASAVSRSASAVSRSLRPASSCSQLRGARLELLRHSARRRFRLGQRRGLAMPVLCAAPAPVRATRRFAALELRLASVERARASPSPPRAAAGPTRAASRGSRRRRASARASRPARALRPARARAAGRPRRARRGSASASRARRPPRRAAGAAPRAPTRCRRVLVSIAQPLQAHWARWYFS